MKTLTLTNLKAKHVPYDNDGFGYVLVWYNKFEIHVSKCAFDGTYEYRDSNRVIRGTHYSSLADVKAAIREEVAELKSSLSYQVF